MPRVATIPALFEGLIPRAAVYQRNGVRWFSANAWSVAAKPETMAALKDAKSVNHPAVVSRAADDLASLLSSIGGDWPSWSVSSIACGHSKRHDCFGKVAAISAAKKLNLPFVEIWEDRFCSGVSHPKEFKKLPPLTLKNRPPGNVLILDDIATSGWHMEEALRSVRALGVTALGAVWIGGEKADSQDEGNDSLESYSFRYPTSGQIANLLGKSTKSINDMKGDGRLPVIEKKINLALLVSLGVAAYAEQKTNGALDLTAERARLAKEQADATAMKNEVARGELLPAGEVTEAMRKAFAACRARLLAIPAKVAPLVADTSSRAECRDILTDAIHQACDELADTRVEHTLRDQASDRDSDSDGLSDLEEPPEADGKPMGGRGKGAKPRG